MTGNASAPDGGLAGRDRVCLLVQGLLRGAQAKGWTDDALSAASGVPARTIKSYRVEGKEPCLTNALSLGCVLGPAAINGLLSIIGYGGAKPLDETDEHNPGEIVATVMRNLGVIATAAADGRFDHIEQPSVRDASDMIIAELLPHSSAGCAA